MAVARYWGGERAYHHTAPVTALLGLHAGLRRVLAEGLEARWRRHEEVGRRLQDEIVRRGGRLIPPEGHRLPQLTAFTWPADMDEARLRRRLLEEHGIEVGGGLGRFAGTAWRVGLMGEGTEHGSVDRLLAALDDLLVG